MVHTYNLVIPTGRWKQEDRELKTSHSRVWGHPIIHETMSQKKKQNQKHIKTDHWIKPLPPKCEDWSPDSSTRMEAGSACRAACNASIGETEASPLILAELWVLGSAWDLASVNDWAGYLMSTTWTSLYMHGYTYMCTPHTCSPHITCTYRNIFKKWKAKKLGKEKKNR